MDPVVLGNRYRLGDLVGRGGVADVYRGEDLLLGRSVAVKMFRFSGDDTPQRIDAEMRTLAALNHPGLVTLFDAEFGDTPFLVMELVDGPTIRSVGRPFEPDEVIRYAKELSETLAYVHSLGIVHRDIKPGNILLGTPRSSVGEYSTKLADFGIARFLDSARLTAHGATVGTAHYISPEQALGHPVTPASDIYSLALVLIECQSGRMVFGGDAVAAAVARLHHDPEVPTTMGPAWSALMADMTARNPADRPAAAEVARRLEHLDTPATMILPVAAGASRRPMALAGLLALVGLTVVGAYLLTRPQDVTDSVVLPTTSVVEPTPAPEQAAVTTTSVTAVPVAPSAAPSTTAEPAPAMVPAPAAGPAPAAVPPAKGNGNSGPGNNNSGPGNNSGQGNGNSGPGNNSGSGNNGGPGNSNRGGN
jgi:serine/threonine protein kinase